MPDRMRSFYDFAEFAPVIVRHPGVNFVPSDERTGVPFQLDVAQVNVVARGRFASRAMAAALWKQMANPPRICHGPICPLLRADVFRSPRRSGSAAGAALSATALQGGQN
jgi:hypothetical protein